MVALANFNPIWSVRRVRLLFAYLLLWLAVPHHAVCRPRELRVPPVGETTTVRVARGGSVEVTLKAFEARANPLAYELVSYPQHGELGEVQQPDRNRQGFASVFYTHNNDEDSTSDEFTFKARSLVGGGVSSPIKVKLQIVDAPPVLQVTPMVRFSAVAGESESQQIMLANQGGGSIEGRIAPREPFHVEGKGRFRLGRGETTNVIVRFSPEAAGGVPPQKISPAPVDPGVTVTLIAEAKAPFFAAADPLRVEPDGTRKGAISITNFSRSPISVVFALEDEKFAEVATDAEIPGEGTAEIPIAIGADKAGGEGELKINVSTPFHRQDLTVAVPAVPPRLELVTPELDFSDSKEADLIVRNTGGVDGRCSLELPGAISSIEGAEAFVVRAGETRRITLRHVGAENAQPPDTLTVGLGKAGKVPVPLFFAAPEPSPSPTPAVDTPSPSPTPKAMAWELNRDVILEKVDGQFFIGWLRKKGGLTDATLEIVDQAGSRAYESESESTGDWWDALKSWWTGRKQEAKQAWEEKEQFFGNRLTVPGEEAPAENPPQPNEGAWLRAAVSEPDARDQSPHWRITAKGEGDAAPKPVSPEFEIDWAAQTLVPAGAEQSGQTKSFPQSKVSPAPEAPETVQVSAPRTIIMKATRKIEAATVVPERTRASVNVAIEEDTEITGFRMERGEIVASIDAKTGIPTNPEFVPVTHPGKVVITAALPAEHEGKKMTVVAATIEGLQPGTATFWRVVPLSGDKELTPTDEFLVPTLPPWQFPWRGFFLGLLSALLVAVLWLRHKSRKASNG